MFFRIIGICISELFYGNRKICCHNPFKQVARNAICRFSIWLAICLKNSIHQNITCRLCVPIYQKQIVFLIIQTGYIFLRQCLTRIGKWFYTPIITQTRMYGNIFVSIDKISLLCIIDKFDIICISSDHRRSLVFIWSNTNIIRL